MGGIRLSHSDVERQISELWDAMADVPHDEHYDHCHSQAVASERRLRDQLATQDRLDAAAPDLLSACEGMLRAFRCIPVEAVTDYDEVQAARLALKAAIAKAKGN